jgi:cell division protein FtsB
MAILLFFLFLRLWVGTGSYTDIWRMEEQIKTQQEANQKQQTENRKLHAEIEEFQSGDSAVVERARSELGMIRKGETFYQIILKPKPDPEPEAVDGVSANEPSTPVDNASAADQKSASPMPPGQPAM